MKIALLSPIAPEATEALSARHDVRPTFDSAEADLPELLADREALVVRSGVKVSEELLASAESMRLIVRAGSGLDNVDVDAATRRGVRVVRVPGPSAQAVAELTFALLLGVSRRVTVADRAVREGRWPKRELGGNLLRGKTLGIVGTGSIGGRVAELGVAWQMRAIGCVANPSEERRRGFEARGIELADLDRVAREANFLCVHTPLDASTHHLIDAEVLSKMKAGGYVVNTARGGVVDEAALYDALTSGHLSGAALDVHEEEGAGVPRLAELPNVALTPHIGGMALESQREIGARIVDIVDHFEQASEIPHLDGVVPVA
jgi:phosphoglycerate dehydrogenase-like enzyme